MGPCQEIYQEGLRIPPVKLVRAGMLQSDVFDLILYNVRTPVERRGDLTAQIGACKVGEARLHEVVAKYGLEAVQRLCAELLAYSEQLVRNRLSQMPPGNFQAEDFLDDDGISTAPVPIRVSVTLDPEQQCAVVDFAGSSKQVDSSINAVFAITYSAVYYVFRCLLPDATPATSGIMRAITVVAPDGTIVNARPP